MHAKAEGPLKKLIFVLVVFVVVIALGTYSIPFAAEYEVKTAAKVACNEYRQQHMLPNRPWEEKFVRSARGAGVNLRNDQFLFELADFPNLGELHCTIKVAWRSSTPLMFINEVVALPHLKLLHRIETVHIIKKTY